MRLSNTLELPLMFAALLVAAACSSGGGNTDNAQIQRALPPDVPVETLLETADESQVALFRDGAIDFADYERATFAFLGCMEEAGFPTLDGPAFDEATQRFEASFRALPGSGPAGEVQLECAREHELFVRMAWVWQHAPREETLQRARAALGACLRDAGYEFVPEIPTYLDYDRVRAAGGGIAFNECALRVGEEYKIPSFGG